MSEELFSQEKLQYNDLTNEESKVINNKGTEAPFRGKYVKTQGSRYLCLQKMRCCTLLFVRQI